MRTLVFALALVALALSAYWLALTLTRQGGESDARLALDKARERLGSRVSAVTEPLDSLPSQLVSVASLPRASGTVEQIARRFEAIEKEVRRADSALRAAAGAAAPDHRRT
ncbi:MAG: hypothetical protein FJ290_19370 [Planctomycetes bacterium]|nr:hypothetical protein [Planctomycetota bacterium]